MQLRSWRGVVWAPFVVVGSLLLAPASGWLVRAQLVGVAGTASGSYPTRWGSEVREKQVAESDFGAAMAYALRHPVRDFSSETDTGMARADTVMKLRARFLNEPALYANALRFATQGAVQVKRSAEQEILSPSRTNANTPPSRNAA